MRLQKEQRMTTQKHKRMQTQIPNERLALNGKLGPGALGLGPRAKNIDKICLPERPTE